MVHRLLAATYLQYGFFDKGKKEVDLLIHQYPLVAEYYEFISKELISKQRYDEALEYVKNGFKLRQNSYFTKWIGIINLSKLNIDTAIIYLEKSIEFDHNDSQVLYNLSGAYSQKKEYIKALATIEECLRINPNYGAAIALKKQLVPIIENQKK